MKKFERVSHKPQNISIQDMINMVDNGYKLQEIKDIKILKDSERLALTNSIILTPDYQREYRATIKDESSLIESLILGIPIPAVFLSNDRYEGIKVLNVVDGQHRLRAFHRFCKNQYKLIEMKFLHDLEAKNFEEIPFEIKEQILGEKISAIVFENFPGIEFELEIFNRYNKGTKPLSPQEIRHAVYNSKLNHYVNSFVKGLMSEPTLGVLKEAYNVTKDRFQKKKVQESIFVILSILEYGINIKYSISPVYAENYMKEKSEFEKKNPEESDKKFENIKKRFEDFNDIIIEICKKVEYPFSKEIYGISSRNYKFQMSTAMIIAGIFNKIFQKGKTVEEVKDKKFLENLLEKIAVALNSSYLEDPEYNASSTNSNKMIELINTLEKECILE